MSVSAVQPSMKKRDGRLVSRAALEEMRLMALQRMGEGESPAEVASSFGLHRGWAYKVLARAQEGGAGALMTRKGSGRPRTLTPAQERQVFGWVNGKNPRQHGFDFGLWTRQVVRELIEKKFAARLSLASVGTLLARLGPQKPLQHAYQRDPLAVAQWEKQTYPAIVKHAKREKAEIYFWDESGFRADAVQGRTWAVKGVTPVVAVPGQRQSISAASAVNSKGGFWFAVYSGGLNGELFVDLLKRMMKGRRRPIHLVLDGLPAHKTRGVRDYVDSLKGRLTLHFLPGYAPDLNPDELVWSYTKRTGVARSPLRSGEKLADRVHDQLSDIAARPELVRSFFRHPSVAYISDL
ncbi:IS630 family transposase [Xanthomonas oryzae]|uniref:IS630 family transposase n=1 Tax=Xanthomonas oryzae TaxID=347 RepID=UPI00072F53E7|nr:IS630 family transposase [Xanthomonas oryzae]ALS93957.1 DDE endonuclease [Xanthomonas oryzae pv. oryzae]AVU03777.1 IS630 family transposase [Xanthomonas oryzae pv. oryzae]UWI56186.1 IS630 family transposase [Xanthomonas oryzae pv. oryzae]